jgi:hypothetical protein
MFPAYTTYKAVRKLPLTTTFLGFLKKFPNQESSEHKRATLDLDSFFTPHPVNLHSMETTPSSLCLADKRPERLPTPNSFCATYDL